MSNHIEQVPEPSESPEQKRMKTSRCNLRKSLAWDSAFFTSEGVLNTEELAMVNSTFIKSATLPGIPEETRRSSESASTLDSDSFSLESLEIELFENVRASIQKSLGIPGTASKLPTCGFINDQKGLNPPHLFSKEKAVRHSQNKMKLPAAMKGHGLSKQRTGSISETPVAVKVANTGAAEPTVSKPPRALPKASLPRAPSKITTPSGSTHKCSSTGTMVNRQPINKTTEDSGTATSISTGPPKSISSFVSGNVRLTVASSSKRTLGHRSSDSSKSPSESAKKATALSGLATNKTPIRSSRSKLGSRSPNDLASHANLRSKFLNTSPSSSIDSVISETSSSASTTLKSNKITDSLDAGSSSSSPSIIKNNAHSSGLIEVSSDPTAPKFQRYPNSRNAGNASRDFTVESASRDLSRNKVNARSQERSFKPSGLRMPTPKIGYFDADKSLVRNADAGYQISLLGSSTCEFAAAVEADTTKRSKLQCQPTKQKFASTVNSSPTHMGRTTPTFSAQLQQESKPASCSAHEKKSDIALQSNESLHQTKGNRSRKGCQERDPLVAVRVEENVSTNNTASLNNNLKSKDLNVMMVELMAEKVSELSL